MEATYSISNIYQNLLKHLRGPDLYLTVKLSFPISSQMSCFPLLLLSRSLSVYRYCEDSLFTSQFHLNKTPSKSSTAWLLASLAFISLFHVFFP